MLRDRTLSSWPFHWATDGAGWGGGWAVAFGLEEQDLHWGCQLKTEAGRQPCRARILLPLLNNCRDGNDKL